MAQQVGYGVGLTVTTTTAAASIGQIISISGPNASGSPAETSTLDSTSRFDTFIGTMVDPGEVTIETAYNPESIARQRLHEYLASQAIKTFTITWGDTSVWPDTEAFSAIVTGIGREIPLKDRVTSTITLKVTGDPKFKVST